MPTPLPPPVAPPAAAAPPWEEPGRGALAGEKSPEKLRTDGPAPAPAPLPPPLSTLSAPPGDERLCPSSSAAKAEVMRLGEPRETPREEGGRRLSRTSLPGAGPSLDVPGGGEPPLGPGRRGDW